MNYQSLISLALVTLLLSHETMTLDLISRLPKSRGFLLYRTVNSISQRPCSCSKTYSCSCCEIVTLLYNKRQKTLCSNFEYQRDGLNVSISLDMDTIKTTTISTYRPFNMCSAIPGTIFSSLCVNVLELNQFPRSLTVCVRHEIVDRIQEWRIDYTCFLISTELPQATKRSTTNEETTAAMTSSTTIPTTMATSPTTTTTAPPATESTESTERPSSEAETSSAPSATTATNDEELSSSTAIIGARKKRRARIYGLKKNNIVNNARRAIIINDESKRTNEKTEISNSTNIAPSVGTIVAKQAVLPVREIERKASHDRDDYFPSRIPPVVEKSIAEKQTKMSVVIDKKSELFFGDDSINNKTDVVVFPD